MRLIIKVLIAGLLAAAIDRRFDFTGADTKPFTAPARTPTAPISEPNTVKMLGGIPIRPPTAAQWNGLISGTTRSVDCGRDASCNDR